MILETFESQGVQVHVSYAPVWELCFSLHVLAQPEHHLYREKWARKTEAADPELTRRIRAYSDRTNQWTLLIDLPAWSRLRQMEPEEFFGFCRSQNIYQWNRMLAPLGKSMTVSERNETLDILEEYHRQVFRQEEPFLRACILRVLRREAEDCRRRGVWDWCRTIHERLEVREDSLCYRKNREYVYPKGDIHTLYLSASTFLDPHLWLYHSPGELEMIRSIRAEHPDAYHLPEQTVRLLKALGDESRLSLLRLLFLGDSTTQELARQLDLSPAAISKHLKILWEAGLVRKQPEGHYVRYRLNTEAIDFIPYSLYELFSR